MSRILLRFHVYTCTVSQSSNNTFFLHVCTTLIMKVGRLLVISLTLSKYKSYNGTLRKD